MKAFGSRVVMVLPLKKYCRHVLYKENIAESVTFVCKVPNLVNNSRSMTHSMYQNLHYNVCYTVRNDPKQNMISARSWLQRFENKQHLLQNIKCFLLIFTSVEEEQWLNNGA